MLNFCLTKKEHCLKISEEKRRLFGLSRREFLRRSCQGASLAFVPSGFGSSLFVPVKSSPRLPNGEYQVHPHYRTPRTLDALIRKVKPGFDDFIAEKYHDQVAAVLDRWTTALLRAPAETTSIEATLSATLIATSPMPADLERLRSSSFLNVTRSKFSPEKPREPAVWVRDWRSSMAHFSALQSAEFQVTDIQLNKGSNLPSSIRTRVRCELVGSGSGFHREHRIGNWDLTWALDATGELKITKWLILDETRSKSLSRVFTDATQQTLGRNASYAAQLLPSIDHWRTVLDGASGIDIYGHNGVSVADIDGDGLDDLYICQPAGLPNRLFRNRGDGSFEDITEASGLGLLDNTASALFADISNSGRQDAIIVRTDGPLLFLNDGHGKFHLKPDAFHFANEPQGTFTGAAVADYDRDGWLDIYFCLYIYYQGTDQYRYPTPYYDANNGPPNFMFRNNRDGSFRDVTKETNLDRNNTRFSFCCGWADYDGNGWPDLYVVNDFGRKNLYRNNGNGTFTDVAPEAGVEDVGAGMSVSWFDSGKNGKQDLYVADMWTAAGARVSRQDAFQKEANPEARAFYRKHAMGNSLFRNRDGKRFDDLTSKSGTAIGRWAWCSDSWDFDHDGYADLYIANGMITGPAPVRDDLNSFFWRQVVAN